jgi:YD repeat-containing protein
MPGVSAGASVGFLHSSYHASPAHHLRDVIGPDGQRVSAMSYDAGGRLSQVCDAQGACSQSSYDLSLRTVMQTDPSARAMSYAYDARGNVLSQTDAL